MKIAFIGEKISPVKIDGTQRYVEEVSNCMAQMGHQVFIYGAAKNLSKKEETKVEYIFSKNVLSKYFGETLKVFFATMHALFSDYDVVHYQSQNSFFLSKLIEKFRPQTKVVSSFDLICDFKSKPGTSRKISKDVDAILKYNLRSKRFALFANNLTKESGAHYLIEAFKKLEDAATTPNNFKLVLFETGSRDEEYVKYLHTISENRSNIILIKGDSKKLADQLFSHAYLFVESSEILQKSSDMLLRAMSYGLAPVVSNINENVELVGQAGSIFISKSVADLQGRLAFLLSRSDEIERIGKMAKEKIEKEHSWEMIAKKTIEN